MERNKASRPQEVLDLVHERQHGPIDRRTFLHGAGRFAVGGLTAGAIFETMRPSSLVFNSWRCSLFIESAI